MLKTDKLEKENTQLKQQLKTILKNAHDNEDKLKRFEQIEFKLMDANTMGEILDVLVFDYPSLFNINFSSLLLIDSDLKIKSFLAEVTMNKKYQNNVSLLHLPTDIEKIRPLSKRIYLGDYQHHNHQYLFRGTDNNKTLIKSIAILPLIRHKQLIGIFYSASVETKRFDACYGSDFMKHMSYTISVCIENVLNYEKLKLTTLTDPLTKIRNRRFFDQYLYKEVSHLQRSNTPLSCLLLDIDHFKKVNDNYGHTAGDMVLIQVVKRIQTILRADEILARYGGEEFVLLLPETDNSYALNAATRIIHELNKKPILIENKKPLTITISIGLATLFNKNTLKNTFSSNNPKEVNYYSEWLIKEADKALYQAKETGRNKVCNKGILSG
jgi:two-component system, cell cycle response regulator